MKKPHNCVKGLALVTPTKARTGKHTASIFCIFALFFINGCSLMQSIAKPIDVKTIAEMPKIYDPPLPLELQLVDIDWTIFTPELMQQYLEDVNKGEAPRQAFYALTTKEYENLSMNTADQKRYLKEILSIVKYYRELDEQEEN